MSTVKVKTRSESHSGEAAMPGKSAGHAPSLYTDTCHTSEYRNTKNLSQRSQKVPAHFGI